MLQLIAKDINQATLGTDRVIDNPLGQFKGQVEQRKQAGCHNQQNELIALGVFPDKLKECAFYGTAPKWLAKPIPSWVAGSLWTGNGLTATAPVSDCCTIA
ncbi:hypothetical protein MACH18_26500 [Phaeobacter italicus]|nr:hypothetical protein MACH18_26500 [Phaeobacter italicus]